MWVKAPQQRRVLGRRWSRPRPPSGSRARAGPHGAGPSGGRGTTAWKEIEGNACRRWYTVVLDAKLMRVSAGNRHLFVENNGVGTSVFKGGQAGKSQWSPCFARWLGVAKTTPRFDDSLGGLMALIYFGQRTQQSQQRRMGRGLGAPGASSPEHLSVEPLRMPVTPQHW